MEHARGYDELIDVINKLSDHHTKLCDVVVDESEPMQKRERAQFLGDNILTILLSLARVRKAMLEVK